VASPGSRGEEDSSSSPATSAEAFDAKLAEREAAVRAGLAELEEQLEELDTLARRGCTGAVERATLRDAFETLRRELDCIVAARRAVATLRPDAARADLAALRAEQRASGQGSERRRGRAPSEELP
jgi:hypothetical protein